MSLSGKNCKDKPKYGGPGIKKQACLRRACNNPLIDTSADTDGTKEGFLSVEPSPSLWPTTDLNADVAPLDLGAEEAPEDDDDDDDMHDLTSGMMLATRRRLDELRAFERAESDCASTELDGATAYSTVDETDDNDVHEGDSASRGTRPNGFPVTASLLMVAAARAGDTGLLQSDRAATSSIPS